MNIIDKLARQNPCYKAGRTIVPKGVMIHSVGCSQPDPLVFVRNWQRENAQVCVHAVLGTDGNVYQLLPWNHRAWHCGSGNNGSCNNTHISFEMTEPATIRYTGGATWVDNDPAKTKAHVMATYKAAVEFTAYICKEYGLNPLADGVVISHSEGHKRGLASNHGDVEHIWNKFGLTMNQFRKDVQSAMESESKPQTPADQKPSGTLYRVQAGAYSKKENADAQLKKVKAAGFEAFMVKAGGLYKIQVGAYSVKANADNMLAKMKAAGFDAFITTQTGQAVSAEPPKPPKKSVTEIAKEVIRGKWGNGADRKKRLETAGYNYKEVQEKVNELL